MPLIIITGLKNDPIRALDYSPVFVGVVTQLAAVHPRHLPHSHWIPEKESDGIRDTETYVPPSASRSPSSSSSFNALSVCLRGRINGRHVGFPNIDTSGARVERDRGKTNIHLMRSRRKQKTKSILGNVELKSKFMEYMQFNEFLLLQRLCVGRWHESKRETREEIFSHSCSLVENRYWGKAVEPTAEFTPWLNFVSFLPSATQRWIIFVLPPRLLSRMT